MIVPVFIPHQGCPYRCVFCNQHEISGAGRKEDAGRIQDAFETYLFSSPPDRLPPHREVAFYGGTFTGLPGDRQERLLSMVQRRVEEGWVQAIRISTHADFIDAERLNRLQRFTVRTVELGVQSTNTEVLNRSGRVDAFRNVPNAAVQIRQAGFQLGIQLMAGLAGDDESVFMKTVEDTIRLAPGFVRIYPTVVLRGTALYNLFCSGEYVPWTLERTVAVLARALRAFEKAGIPVIRVGLHPEASMLDNLVAGPHHPALRSLVESQIALEDMTTLLGRQKPLPERVVIQVPSNRICNYTGYRRQNIARLKGKFSLRDLVLEGQDGLTAITLAV